MAMGETPESVETPIPSLNTTLIGQLDPLGIALYRGIPYATVEKRWTHSKVQHSLASPFDATRFGPRCPQKEGPILVFGSGVDPVPGDDEFKCLNLNIAVPKENLPQKGQTQSKGIPVLVWIHGGAFNYGCNSVARYRPSRLCDLARSINKPVVLVQINYRLGPLGFAASRDFEQVQSKEDPNGESACIGNFGFIDQRNAFQWVREHIRDFGGDPEQVTAAGISAGSQSIHYHILTGQPLFDRGILMSGCAGCLGPVPLELHDKEWLKACTFCGIVGLSPETRYYAMRAMSPETLIQVYTTKAMGPYGDGKILPLTWTYGDEVAPSRCKSIIIGNVQNEGIVFDIFAQYMPQYAFIGLLMEHIPDAKVREGFYRAFGFSTADYSLGSMPQEAYRDALRLFFSVAAFHFPSLRVAETFASGEPSRKAYLYHFEDRSPWDGVTKGHSYHGQCAMYLFQNETGQAEFPDSSAKVSERLAEKWVEYAYGIEPWSAYAPGKGQEQYTRFGPDGKCSTSSIKVDDVRLQSYLPWLRDHWDDVERLARRLLLES